MIQHSTTPEIIFKDRNKNEKAVQTDLMYKLKNFLNQ